MAKRQRPGRIARQKGRGVTSRTRGGRSSSLKRYRKPAKYPMSGARRSLRNFRQATILAVAITGFIFLFFDPATSTSQDVDGLELPDTVSVIEDYALEDLTATHQATDTAADEANPAVTAYEAVHAVREMLRGFYRSLPKILVATAILLIIWLLVKGINALIKSISGQWERTEAVTTLIGIIFWIFGIGIAISVLAEDVRALIGSLGLVGLALSWALQSPIESFTGWLLNKFKGYYRVGDRVIVGEVVGDVYKIDFVNTTLWEIGDPFSPGFVGAEQPTGRLVTFPNNEIVNGVIINFTSDFPYVWDELSIQVANESDLSYAMTMVEEVAVALFGPLMKEPTQQYERILRRARLEESVPDRPQIFLAAHDSWTNIVVRYLVNARERRKWKSELLLKITNELKKPEHAAKIVTAYPHQQIQLLNERGIPVSPDPREQH